jgi:hypothetical protein
VARRVPAARIAARPLTPSDGAAPCSLLSTPLLVIPPAALGGFRLIIFGPSDSVLVTGGAWPALPGEAAQCHRSVALLRGKFLAASLLPRRAPEVWSAVLPSDGHKAASALFHALVACAPDDDAPAGHRWIAPYVLAAAQPHTAPWLAAAADALAAVQELPTSTVLARLDGSRSTQAVPMAQLVRDAEQANALLRKHCERTPCPAWQPDLFTSWGERVPAVGIPADVGATSCREQLDLSEDAVRLPFCFSSPEFWPPRSAAAPPVPAQRSTYKPASVRDILTAEALEQIYQWFRGELNDLRGYSEDPPRKHRSNKPLVIDQNGFVKEARGSFWDLTTKPPSLMQRQLPGKQRLNVAAILATAGADYPDKELLDGIAHGVRMPTDNQMLIVLNPGLFSLAGHLRTYSANIARMAADGMLKVCRFLPYVPCVLLPQGTVWKAHDEEARRRTTDAGAPRAPLVAHDGKRVVSINDGVRLPDKDGQPKTQSEDKPCVAVNVNDSSILAALAAAMRKDGFAPHEYQAYFACYVFKAFFNQFSLHPSEWSRFCLAVLQAGYIYVAAELVLSFGCAPSSGIAQRFAHLVRQVVTERIAAEDAPFVADLRRRARPHVRAWFAHRDALTAET